MTRPRRLLYAMVSAAMPALVGTGLLVGTGALPTGLAVLDAAPPSPARLAAAVVVVAAAQLARLRIPVEAGSIVVAWGEGALVVLCVLLPLSWVPAAVALGVSAAQLLARVEGRRRTTGQMVYAVASLTVAATVGAGLANLFQPTYRAPFTPSLAFALAVGALGYGGTGAWLVVVRVTSGPGIRVLRVVREALTNKLPMLIGNVAVGLLIVALLGPRERWLLLLPPGLWLLHQVYTYRLRGDDERRTWQAFAEATRELNRLDERGAAAAGIRGALRLFPAFSAELVVIDVDGAARGYRGTPGSEVVECTPSALRNDPSMAARTLLVGGTRVGELRLHLRRPATLRNRDLLMFSAYGDALAAALHDAATHDELRALSERSSYEASHDPLSGLASRGGFLASGDTVLRELRHDAPVALLLLDIDHFKDVNDTLGHAAGDELLQVAGQRVAAALRPDEMAARLGGDEFAVLIAGLPSGPAEVPPGLAGEIAALSGVDPVAPAPPEVLPGVAAELAGADHPVQLAHALGRARSLAEELATPSEVARVQLSVEVSIGVVVAAAGAVDVTELLRRADVAMYQAKRGGSSVAWYDPSRDQASTDRLALLAEMREALSTKDQLDVVLQPAVLLSDGRPTGAEALIRWQHPRRGLLMPVDFVKVVELSELLAPFTRYVLDRAIELAAGWSALGLDLPIAVNLSPRSLLDRRLPKDVAALLARHGVPARRLILEITETVVMSELKVIDEVLSRLRELGVQIAVDDFGTGYSSLTFLTRVVVDEVKVDRTFVRRMVDSPEAAAIVRTTVDLGKRLGLRVVAEGVETAEQRAALTALGCTAAQGFHFFQPMAPARATEVLRSFAPARPAAPVIPLRAAEDAS
jgi:predicted signal transduction protein with EAL and GGDEF domain